MFWLPALATGPKDGRYTLDDGAVVRLVTGSDGALLLTAESAGTQSVPRNPRLSDVQVHSGRYFNGRFAASSDNPGKFERVFTPSGQGAGAEFYLYLQPDESGSGLLATWVQYPDTMNTGGSVFRKAVKLTGAAALTKPSLGQDLAGRWMAGNDVMEIFAAGEALTVFRSQASPMLEPSPLETFSLTGQGQSFAGPAGFVLEAVSSTQVLLRNGPSVKTFNRDVRSPALANADQRVGIARRTAQGETVLHLAARDGDLTALNRALSAKVDINAIDAKTQTALHVAVEAGKPDIVQALIRAGAFTTKVDVNGKTAMQLAVAQNNPQMLAAMMAGGASLDPMVDQTVKIGDMTAVRSLLAMPGMAATLAAKAIEHRKPAVLDEVLVTKPEVVTLTLYQAALVDREIARSVLSYAQKGSSFNFDTAMQYTIQRDQRALMSDLLQKGAKPDAALLYAVSKSDLQLMTELVETYGANADTPLVPAIKAGQLPIVLLLLQNGANAGNGLSAAIEANHAPIAEALIQKGAPATDPQFLDKAARAGNADMVRLLLTAGAPAQAALGPAVAARRGAVVKLLVESGADGADPLLLQTAASNGDDASVAILLAAGAPAAGAVRAALNGGSAGVMTQVLKAGADGSDPALLVDATGASKSGALSALLAAGGDVNTRDNSGRPLIVIAAASADVATVSALLLAGADKEAADTSGNRAIHVAVLRKKGELDIVERLIQAGVDVNAPDGNGKLPRALSSGIRVPWALRNAGAKNKLDE
ncbi:MAG: ankyrin repeat domain-containing protein [Panacagrimonas sp.]